MAAEQQLDDQLVAVSTTPTPPYNYSWFSVATTADLNAFYFYEQKLFDRRSFPRLVNILYCSGNKEFHFSTAEFSNQTFYTRKT
ncbi:hypothetical protein J6590_019307 [Homalodisca vitripennis]|nr:hypothetical protein J6590_019307 [Homalodisca vitripennis]